MQTLFNDLKEQMSLIEGRLKALIPVSLDKENLLYQVVRYALLAKGKRLRPLICLVTAQMLGKEVFNAIDSACALEMIHTYSLIHDDLPCMDDDDWRRGRPSVHKAFSEGQAVLAGDYLLTHAFLVIAKSSGISNDQKVRLIEVLASLSGGDGMVLGQSLDLLAMKEKIDMKTLRTIHAYKTGAMFIASLLFGAIIANASKKEEKILESFGSKIGLAFQIVDDILDATSKKEVLGKSICSDQMNDKITFVNLMSVKEAKITAENLLESALEDLSPLPFNTDNLEMIAQKIVHRYY